MNSVYFIFLAVIIISFITGLIITFIDNKNGQPFDKELSAKSNQAAVAATSQVTQSIPAVQATVAEAASDMVVPYIPIQQNAMPAMPVVQEPVVAAPVVQQPVVQQSVAQQSPVVSAQATSIIPVISNSSMEHKIQIEDAAEPEYFTVPVLIPMSMDDDSL
jgi:hypothetical protein